jgi:peroxiredoxin Q/BCP
MRGVYRWSVGLALAGLVAFVAGGRMSAQEKGAKVKVGDPAPSFQAPDENGKTWRSEDHVGKKVVVLYFYPADFTGGCTKQACGYRDDIEKLAGKGIEVIGVSGDTPKTHLMFKQYHKLPFTLLADEQGTIAKKFGVPVTKGGQSPAIDSTGQKVAMDRPVTIQRFTVVIDKGGKIAALDQVKDAGGDPKRIADVVKNLESN